MKVNTNEEIERDTLLSHIVLNGLTDTITTTLLKVGTTPKGIICEIALTVNGHDVSIEPFCTHWQSQAHRMIREEAETIVKDKMYDVEELLNDLHSRLQDEVSKRLKDWEKEEIK
jgi:hypothetical protein